MRQGIFLPESTFSADTLTVSAYSTGVQARASTSVRTLTIPNTGSHIIVWTHENTTHTDRMGICIYIALLLRLLGLMQAR